MKGLFNLKTQTITFSWEGLSSIKIYERSGMMVHDFVRHDTHSKVSGLPHGVLDTKHIEERGFS